MKKETVPHGIPRQLIGKIEEIQEVDLRHCNDLLRMFKADTGFPGYRWVLLDVVAGTEVCYPDNEPRCPIPSVIPEIRYVLGKIKVLAAMKKGGDAFQKLVSEAAKHRLLVHIEQEDGEKEKVYLHMSPGLKPADGAFRFASFYCSSTIPFRGLGIDLMRENAVEVFFGDIGEIIHFFPEAVEEIKRLQGVFQEEMERMQKQ